MSTTQPAPAQQAERTVQRYRIWVEATPERVWQALTDPAENGRYGYGAPGEFELRPGGTYRSHATDAMQEAAAEMGVDCPDVVVDGEVLEATPPRRLVQTWRMLMDPGTAAEGFSRLTYDIAGPGPDGAVRLTVSHELTGKPRLAAMVAGVEDLGAPGGGGWAWLLSDLKTYLETGRGFTQAT
jgi:uncharacterized protein YndB with AHSA1/START domain